MFSSYFIYNYSRNSVEDSFLINKNIISESISKHYSEFINKKLLEFSLYYGYLDSTSVKDFVSTTFKEYEFVDKVFYYDTYLKILDKSDQYQDPTDRFVFDCKYVFSFSRDLKEGVKTERMLLSQSPLLMSDFEQMVLKFNVFIRGLDAGTISKDEAISKNFFSTVENKILYMSVPRAEDLNVFKRYDYGESVKVNNTLIHQDIISFMMQQDKIKIDNIFPTLYDHIKVCPAMYVPIMSPDSVYTSIELPGALSEYKMEFVSANSTINRNVWIFFLPLEVGMVVLYAVLVFILYLIFRNTSMREKMFKLQYDFINNLTHEFKTPVSVIKIAGNNLKKDRLVSEQERANYAKILDEEAEKLNQMINKILSFTQIENRSIEINVDDIDVSEFIISTIDVFQVKYPDFEITFDNSEVSNIYTDAVLLGSIFDNLFENAYKYSPSNRKKLHILAKRNRNHVSISFIDQGIGISKSEIDNIFKKFYRIESTYNQNGSVGLGLAFCKEVSHLLGGDIIVKSQLSEGSEFIVNLPIKITYENDR